MSSYLNHNSVYRLVRAGHWWYDLHACSAIYDSLFRCFASRHTEIHISTRAHHLWLVQKCRLAPLWQIDETCTPQYTFKKHSQETGYSSCHSSTMQCVTFWRFTHRAAMQKRVNTLIRPTCINKGWMSSSSHIFSLLTPVSTTSYISCLSPNCPCLPLTCNILPLRSWLPLKCHYFPWICDVLINHWRLDGIIMQVG